MTANIVIIVIGVLFSVFCLVGAGAVFTSDENRKVAGGIMLVVMGIFCMGLISLGAFFFGTGKPALTEDVSNNPIYLIQARLAYNDGVNGIVVIKDAEKSDSKFRIVDYKMKELPDANLVRIEDKKFVPFTLCQKTQ